MNTTLLIARLPARAGHDLLDDLGGGQVAGEPGLPGGAEGAVHAAAGLARDAHGHALGVAHQHALHEGAVEQPPEHLAGGAAVGGELAHLRHQRRGEQRRQVVARCRRDVGPRRRVVCEAVEVLARHLVGAEGRRVVDDDAAKV